jgi:nicotinate-nucleotide--dimethylbenzimidazole phosphoribosyltransferase
MPQMVVFAADHGLAAQGVSAYPVDVTWQMVETSSPGGAAVSVLSLLRNGIDLNVVDCGVAATLVCEQDPAHKLPKAASHACGGARWLMARRTAARVRP